MGRLKETTILIMSRIPTSSRLPVPQRSGIPSRTLSSTSSLSVSKTADIENRQVNNVPKPVPVSSMAKPTSSDDSQSVSSVDRTARQVASSSLSSTSRAVTSSSTASRGRSDDNSSVGSGKFPHQSTSEPKVASSTSMAPKRSLSASQNIRTSHTAAASSLRPTNSLVRPVTTETRAIPANSSGPKSIFGGQKKTSTSSSLTMDHIPTSANHPSPSKKASPKPSPYKQSPAKNSPKNSPGKKQTRPPLDPVKQLEILAKRADNAREKCFSEKQELVDRIFRDDNEADPALEQLIQDSQWIAPNVTMLTFLKGNRVCDQLVQNTNKMISDLGAE